MSKLVILLIKEKKGFLLVEVLLTIAILAIGITTIVRSFLISLRAGKISADYVQAQMLLDNNLNLLENEGEVDSGLQFEENFQPPNEKFKFKLNTQNIKVNDEKGDLNEVSASVSWSAQKTNQNISLATYLKNSQNEQGK